MNSGKRGWRWREIELNEREKNDNFEQKCVLSALLWIVQSLCNIIIILIDWLASFANWKWIERFNFDQKWPLKLLSPFILTANFASFFLYSSFFFSFHKGDAFYLIYDTAIHSRQKLYFRISKTLWCSMCQLPFWTNWMCWMVFASNNNRITAVMPWTKTEIRGETMETPYSILCFLAGLLLKELFGWKFKFPASTLLIGREEPNHLNSKSVKSQQQQIIINENNKLVWFSV